MLLKSVFEHFYHFCFDPENVDFLSFGTSGRCPAGIVLPEDKQAGKLEAGFEARLQVRVFEGWSRAPQE